MKTPTITIDKKIYEALKPKARAWRNFVDFEKEKTELTTDVFIDRHAELIASLFPEEVTADKVLDNIDLDDILVVYNECFNYIIELISSKLQIANEKNAEAGDGVK